MSGLFGRGQQPSGTADVPINTSPPPQQGGDPNQQQNQGVPPFEGATSGNVTASEPIQGGDPNQQQNQSDPNQQQNQGDPNQQQQQTVQVDPATAYAIQVANEAKVAAEVARQLAQQEATPAEEDTFEEISILGEFNEEELVSDGEKRLVSAAKKLEAGLNTTRKELQETRKQLKVAEDTASKTNVEIDIQRAIAHYGVTRAELEAAYQRSNGKVEDLNILAESALYARLAQQQQQNNQQQLQNTVQQATQEREQETKVVGQQQSNNGNTGTQGNPNEPRGGGKLNPFDGAEVAKHYSAFA